MHTWYLSVDIQFYVFGLILFYIFLRYLNQLLICLNLSNFYFRFLEIKNISFFIMIASCIIATAYCLIVTYIYNYPPTILATAPAVT